MLFTRQYDYALRTIRALSKKNFLSVSEICEGEFIPQPYAYKILKKLEKASIVLAVRGAKGGYHLIKEAKDISLYDVYHAVEGNLYINECMKDNFKCPYTSSGLECSVHSALTGLQDEFIEKLKSIKLVDVLK